jgi:hypothetical protein
MQRYFVLSLILLAVLVLECESESDSSNEVDCTTALCTMEFRTITVLIKHKTDSTFYKLTDFKVNRVSDNKDITVNHNNISEYSGSYPVVNDTKKDLFRNSKVEVEFTGYFNDSIVIQKRFIVTADCCHISLVEGDVLFYI